MFSLLLVWKISGAVGLSWHGSSCVGGRTRAWPRSLAALPRESCSPDSPPHSAIYWPLPISGGFTSLPEKVTFEGLEDDEMKP